MTIRRQERVVEVVREESIILELTPEQAAVISLTIFKSGGPPNSTLRGYADEIMAKFEEVGCRGYDIHNDDYNALAMGSHYWADGSRSNGFFLDLVERFRKIRIG